ncbi:MAG: hypothetical protein M3312_10110 [Actinomycetota bacterium]|nr:hypothetical protein [Actinomycetota bacterium]
MTAARFCLLMVAFFAALLAVDRYADGRGQLLLAAATWSVLLAASRPLSRERRAQVGLVVVAATCTEVIGSILWGVYEYRLGNLPMFVPPAHGLVYLTGLRLSQSRLAGNARAFVAVVLALAAAWTLAGLTLLPRSDVAGAVGTATFAFFVLRGRAPVVYSAVFLVVAGLELYGTALGTWRWAETIPGLGWPDGNPPSGVASGYVLFDVIALSLAPQAEALVERVSSAAPRARPAPGGSPATGAPP